MDPNGDGIACGDSDAFSEGGTGSGGGPSGPYGLYTCADFADQWQAQEAYLQGGNGSDPAADRDILDPDGDGRACEDLPPADREPPAGKRSVEEPSVGEEPEGEKTRRERRERTGGEGSGGNIQGPADNGEETPDSDQGDSSANGNGSAGNDEGGDSGGGNGSDEGGSSSSGNGSAGNDEGGAASQGGVSGAVSDGFGSVLSGRLPDTGGGWTVLALLAGLVLIGGRLLVRRFAR